MMNQTFAIFYKVVANKKSHRSQHRNINHIRVNVEKPPFSMKNRPKTYIFQETLFRNPRPMQVNSNSVDFIQTTKKPPHTPKLFSVRTTHSIILLKYLIYFSHVHGCPGIFRGNFKNIRESRNMQKILNIGINENLMVDWQQNEYFKSLVTLPLFSR